MIQLQIINKILASQDISILENNQLTKDYFLGYEDEFDFITQHYQQYGNVPDKSTFLSKFENFEFIDVTETDKYLVDTAREEYLYSQAVPVVKHMAELLKTDANVAVEYLLNHLDEIKPNYSVKSVDIVSDGKSRYDKFESKLNGEKTWSITTGFPELDEIIHGWSKGEELVVLFARTGQGKSWVLAKTLTHAWQIGENVGYISPEMSADKIGYRFDTLNKNFSNKGLVWGNSNEVDVEQYKQYIEDLANQQNKFMVATPQDFNKKITVSKLKEFVKEHNIGILGIDGITYMTDERFRKGDNKTTTLTNISEDLISLSIELEIPIIVVVQSNRGGVREDGIEGTPELENIRDSDGIAHNATKVISLKQSGGGLEMCIKKHRDGSTGGKLTYVWNINKGEFIWTGSGQDTMPVHRQQERATEIRNQYHDKKEGVNVF